MLMHPHDQGVISTLGVDVHMQLRGFHRPRSRAHLLLPVRFGCPQEIKKAAGSAARNKGTNASKTLGYQRHHPLQAVSGVVGAVNELPKKRSGPTRSQFDASSPHRREHQQGDRRNTYWSSPLRPNDYLGEQPKKKQRSHPLLCSTHSSLTDDALLCSLRYKHFHHR